MLNTRISIVLIDLDREYCKKAIITAESKVVMEALAQFVALYTTVEYNIYLVIALELFFDYANIDISFFINRKNDSYVLGWLQNMHNASVRVALELDFISNLITKINCYVIDIYLIIKIAVNG